MLEKKRFADISQKIYGGVIFSFSYTGFILSLLIVEKKNLCFFFIRINCKNRVKCYCVVERLCHMCVILTFFCLTIVFMKKFGDWKKISPFESCLLDKKWLEKPSTNSENYWKMVPNGAKEQSFSSLSRLVPFGGPLKSPGSPNDPPRVPKWRQTQQNDTKRHQHDTKIV